MSDAVGESCAEFDPEESTDFTVPDLGISNVGEDTGMALDNRADSPSGAAVGDNVMRTSGGHQSPSTARKQPYEVRRVLLSETLNYLWQEYREHWQTALQASGSNAADQLKGLIHAEFAPVICTHDRQGA